MSSKLPKSQDYATSYHAPVLMREVLEYLHVVPGGCYVDATLGGGGHSAAILEASSPNGRLLAIDRDCDAIEESQKRLADFGERVQFWNGSYAEVARACAETGLEKVDGILVDAGVSSHQLDTPERGFSFQASGPLDMRMGQQGPTLKEYLNTVSAKELASVLRQYGEVRPASRLAHAILAEVDEGRMQTTADLRRCVEGILGTGAGTGRKTKIHPATLVFQALRIAVNEELEQLQRMVEQIPDVVSPGGHAVFISFHSLEDRIVKHGFRELAKGCICPAGLPTCICDAQPRVRILTSRPVTATEEEIKYNPRSRSARLRAVEVLELR